MVLDLTTLLVEEGLEEQELQIQARVERVCQIQ
jgi:hypothetical protein